MSNTCALLAPIPNLSITKACVLGDGLSITPLGPKLRRCLLNVAKANKCSDICLSLLTEADALFYAQIPNPNDIEPDSLYAYSVPFSVIADEIIKRIYNCLLLFTWVPKPMFYHHWFFVKISNNNTTIRSMGAVAEYEIDSFESTHIDENIISYLKNHWDKLSVLCQIEQLKKIYTDKDKEKGMIESAKKYVDHKIEEHQKTLYPGATVTIKDEDEAQVMEELEKGEVETIMDPKIGTQWFIEGYGVAFAKEIDKLTQELDRRVINNRFGRAFQFFTDSIRLNDPHNYVGFATCLEILFCTSASEITNQLALRIAWFLSPDNCKGRIKISEQVKSCYDLRSRIVHTGKYIPDSDEFVANKASLQIITRWAFKKILSNNDFYNIFCHKDQNISDTFLSTLPFGNNQPMA